MPRIPLIEHARPRILAVDFSLRKVKKLENAGLNVKRAATGLYDQGKVCIPSAVQDVEIILFECSKGTLDKIGERPIAEESVLEGPYFCALIHEVWDRYGWTIFFVKNGFTPDDFSSLGIKDLGVVERNGYCFQPNFYYQLVANNEAPPKTPTFPRFKGQAIRMSEQSAEYSILNRFIKSAEFYILSMDYHGLKSRADVFSHNPERMTESWIITSESAENTALAIRFDHIDIRYNPNRSCVGGIFILPDFGERNTDVAMALIKELLILANSDIFSEPEHTWLKDYSPYPITVIKQEKEDIINNAANRLNELNNKIENLYGHYSWMDQLLCGEGNDFTEAVAKALEFLEFEIKLIDNQLAPGQRKREDLHVIDGATHYFALGEAKATHRGANESFLSDTEQHQIRYSHENNCRSPYALLIVNHSYDLQPDQRHPFYKDDYLLDRCKASAITAIDSVFLHKLCQQVLSSSMTQEAAREIIKNGPGILRAS